MNAMKCFLLLLLVGCATPTFNAPPTKVGKCWLHIDDTFEASKEEKEFLVDVIRAHLEAWERDHNTKSRWSHVYVYNQIRLRANGRPALGFCRIAEGEIHLIKPLAWHISSMYHELCHLNMRRRDPKHLDPRWYKWKMRQKEINRKFSLP